MPSTSDLCTHVWRAYALGMLFVSVEYVFNVLGNKNANRYLSVFQIMLLIIAFDLVNLYMLNALLLKNRIRLVRDGVSMLLIGAAIAISSDMFGSNR
jgi:hypothetical protein